MHLKELGDFINILIIGFNRSDKILRLVRDISNKKQHSLYLFLDGPRNKEDKYEQDVILHNIEKEKKRFYSFNFYQPSKNLGTRYGVTTAISWFFSSVDFGVILEDDCLPSNDFFYYCQNMKNLSLDNKVGVISGNEYCDLGLNKSYLTDYPLTWGWATWSEIWNDFNVDEEIPKRKNLNMILEKIFLRDYLSRFYWANIYAAIRYQILNTSWDYQFQLYLWRNGFKSVCPPLNLVKNDGWGEKSTHTKRKNRIMDRKTHSLVDNENIEIDHLLIKKVNKIISRKVYQTNHIYKSLIMIIYWTFFSHQKKY